MLIALEGLEGVGKTTIGKIAADLLGATYIKSPPPELNSVREYVASRMESLANFYFYLSGIILLQKEIESALKLGPVIVDRYIGSTIAYHKFGQGFEAPKHADEAIRKPDLTVEVFCSDETRKCRIEARGKHIFDRHKSDETRIAEYFSRLADVRFENRLPVDQAAADLANLLALRLGQDK